MHVLIVGAGVGGLSLAQSLRKQNISLEIFERDTDADSRFQGWALALHSYVKINPTKWLQNMMYTFGTHTQRRVASSTLLWLPSRPTCPTSEHRRTTSLP